MTMAITTEQIKQLREATGAGILDCRKALEDANGDFAKAIELLREKGLSTAAKRADRETLEGTVELYSHGGGRVGVMVEVNCETDFVARSQAFRTFAHEVALQIAAEDPRYVNPEQIPPQVMEGVKDDERVRARAEGKPEHLMDQIVDGRVQNYLNEVCLLRQPYIRDETLTVEKLLLENIAALGENIVIRRFVRWELGESIEKN
jgi:elongation factor Ts